MHAKLPFDRVVVTANGRRHELSADAFMKLPLHQRVTYILHRYVEFFSGSTPVLRRDALQSLRRLNEAG